MKDQTRIIFDKTSINWVLEALGKVTDEKGFVIDKKTGVYELDVDGKKFKPNKIISITKNHWVTKESQLYIYLS